MRSYKQKPFSLWDIPLWRAPLPEEYFMGRCGKAGRLNGKEGNWQILWRCQLDKLPFRSNTPRLLQCKAMAFISNLCLLGELKSWRCPTFLTGWERTVKGETFWTEKEEKDWELKRVNTTGPSGFLQTLSICDSFFLLFIFFSCNTQK